MAFQPVPDVIRTELRASLRGVPVENVLDFVMQPPANPSAADVTNCVNAVAAAWIQHVLPVVGSGYVLNSVYGVDLSVEGGEAFEQFMNPVEPGLLTSETLPNNSALCYTKRTTRAGRSYRGRLYLAGLTEAQVNGNFLAAGIAAVIGNIMNFVASDMETSGFDLVVVSRRNQKVLRPFGVYTRVDSFGLRNERLDSQRGRLPDD